jgi:hypothetical protein
MYSSSNLIDRVLQTGGSLIMYECDGLEMISADCLSDHGRVDWLCPFELKSLSLFSIGGCDRVPTLTERAINTREDSCLGEVPNRSFL